MTLRWPDALLHPQNVAFNIAARTLAAPSSVSGLTQVVASDAGIWKATYGEVLIRNRAQILTFRAIAARLEGRLQPIVVPLCRAWQPGGGAGSGGDSLYDAVPHDDLAFFDDGSGYVGGGISVETFSALPARAVTASVVIHYGGRIEPGQHFSIGERLYRILAVTYSTPTTAVLSFRPPLREAVAEGARLNFDDPVVRCRLASDESMDLDLALHKYGSPTVEFIEDL